MRIGVFVDDMGKTLDEYLADVHAAGDMDLWVADRLAWDPLTLLTIVGREIPGIRLGTGITRTYPRHPLALAAQALTAQAATGNRITLGLGPSHQGMIESQYGYSYDKPARHVREYLTALIPLLRGESVSYKGETIQAEGTIAVKGAQPPPVMLAALGPEMLKIAGELTDGTLLTWANPGSIADYFVPAITKAAAGRPAPRIAASVCVSVTGDPDGARAWLNEAFSGAMSLPSYRKVLERDGSTGIGDTAVVGDESVVRGELQRFADAGVTELVAVPIGSPAEQTRTLELLRSAGW
jgi:F420-dependent oxidoreductase-like protein